MFIFIPYGYLECGYSFFTKHSIKITANDSLMLSFHLVDMSYDASTLLLSFFCSFSFLLFLDMFLFGVNSFLPIQLGKVRNIAVFTSNNWSKQTNQPTNWKSIAQCLSTPPNRIINFHAHIAHNVTYVLMSCVCLAIASSWSSKQITFCHAKFIYTNSNDTDVFTIRFLTLSIYLQLHWSISIHVPYNCLEC